MERSVEASTTIGAAEARVRQVLLDDAGVMFRETHAVDGSRGRQVGTELSVDLGAGASVRQRVTVHLGAPRSTGSGLVLPLSWKAAGHDALLPTFDGELVVSRAGAGANLRLRGTYTVPLGALGRVGDRVVGGRIARRSLAELVERLAAGLEGEVERRVAFFDPAPRAPRCGVARANALGGLHRVIVWTGDRAAREMTSGCPELRRLRPAPPWDAIGTVR